MKKLGFVLTKSIASGMMIGVGCTVYLMCTNKIVGSIFFALGLLSILIYDFYLYTGKAGYVFLNKNPLQLSVIILGNFIGGFLFGMLVRLTRLEIIKTAKEISDIKLSDNLLSILILSVFCGMLMFLAVDIYKNAKDSIVKYLGVFTCIPVFILSGFEHSIANMIYFTIGGAWNFKAFSYIGIMLVGNLIGAVILYFLTSLKSKPKAE